MSTESLTKNGRTSPSPALRERVASAASGVRESKQAARRLRQDATDAEPRMWSALRDRRLSGYKFRRQHPVGYYVVDFACTELRLAIEVDGGQHADNPDDARRTAWLDVQGWRVVRFWNNDALSNTNGVVETILRVLRPSR